MSATCALAFVAAAAALAATPADPRSTVADRVQQLARDASWNLVASVQVGFRTYHPQGMVKIGETLYISSVEVTVPVRRLPEPAGGYDRDAGAGVGHLFAMDAKGNLLRDLRLGEGTVYHPGGLDYDGKDIWVPVAEYRPNSRSIVYRVDPRTMEATAAFRFDDHIGAVVHNTDDHTLHGISWGSRRFYRWTLDRHGRVTNAGVPREKLRTLNTSHYLDYQDCKYAGARRMLCTGVTEMRPTPDAPPFRLGGIDLVNLRDGRPLHQVPVLLWTRGGMDMTHNPVWIEPFDSPGPGPGARGLRAYFMPEDDTSTLYIYEVTTG
jgi:hypothetical protein